MQCLAFYQQDGPGLYVACDDAAGFNKAFAFFGDGEGSSAAKWCTSRSRLPPKAAPETGARVAAALRRSARDVRGRMVHGGGALPGVGHQPGLGQAEPAGSRAGAGLGAEHGLWVWNRGRSPGVLDPAVALREKLGLPVSVFWHWWHGCAYDTGFPEYLPPREGAETFTNALAARRPRAFTRSSI